MEKPEIKAMISLLDDSDHEIVSIVETKIRDLGDDAISPLEEEWGNNSLNPSLQSKIEDLLHNLHFERLQKSLLHWKKEESDDLLKGLWLISTYQFPDLNLATLTEKIKSIYFSVWLKTQDELHPLDFIRVMNEVIFEEYKFESNIKNFHSPSNSMFNLVLEQKKGNPVALSCIYIIIAKMLNVPLYGVNLPSLFVLIFEMRDVKFYVNAFNKGQIFNAKDIDDYLAQMKLNPDPKYYVSCSNEEIIKRILTNLSFSYGKMGEIDKQSEVNVLLKLF